MFHHLPDTITVLTRTPAVLDALLLGLPDSWIRGNEGPNTWNAHDVVGHLIHGEHTDWIPRTQMILRFGATKAFEPFDRAGHARIVGNKPIEQLLDEFVHARSDNLRVLEGFDLTPHHLTLQGRHPELGVVTLSELLATWAAHDLTHLHQLSRVLANQYRPSVGPWTAYLGVYQCNGHSSPALQSAPLRNDRAGTVE